MLSTSKINTAINSSLTQQTKISKKVLTRKIIQIYYNC